MTAVLLALCATSPLGLAPSVIPEEFARGLRLGDRAGTVNRLLLEDRKPLTWWWDGQVRRDVEHAIWLSPALVSRWLGWLARREAWPRGEAERRWAGLRIAMDGQLWFIVGLASYPKLAFVELTEPMPAQPKEMHELDWLVQAGDAAIKPTPRLFAFHQGRNRPQLEDFPWWETPPVSDWLAPARPSAWESPGFPMGEFHRTWWFVSCAVPQPTGPATHLELRILGDRRERLARWPLTAKKR